MAPRRDVNPPLESRAALIDRRLGFGFGRAESSAPVRRARAQAAAVPAPATGMLKAIYNANVNNIASNSSGNLTLVKESGDDIFDVGTYLCNFSGFISVTVAVSNSGVEPVGSALGTQMYFTDDASSYFAIVTATMVCGLLIGLVDQDEAFISYVVTAGDTFLPSYFRGADGLATFPSSHWRFLVSQITS